MKVFFSIILLALIACTQADKQNPVFFGAISKTIESKLLKIRDEMPNGFPKYGIPPLAPLKIGHTELNISKDYLKADATLDDLVLTGLNDFEIEKLKFSILSSKLELSLLFKNITLDTQHDLELWAQKNGLSVEVIAQGPASLSVSELSVKIAAKLSLKTFTLKTLELTVKIGSITSDIRGILGNGAINEQLNNFISTELVDIINDNLDLMTDFISSSVVSSANTFFSTSSVGKFMSTEVFDAVPQEN